MEVTLNGKPLTEDAIESINKHTPMIDLAKYATFYKSLREENPYEDLEQLPKYMPIKKMKAKL